MNLEEAISAIEASDTMDELRSSLHRIIQDYGFSGFTFIDAGRPEVDVPYYTGTHPPAWERAYLQNDFVHIDPALARVRRTNTPFHWGDLKLPEKVGRKRPPGLKMMDAAREHGFKEGFVVPFHYRDRLGAVHSSSTVFFWEDEPHWFQKLFSRHRHELHLIMIYWVQRAMDVVNRDKRGKPTIIQPADVAPPIQLTRRERGSHSLGSPRKDRRGHRANSGAFAGDRRRLHQASFAEARRFKQNAWRGKKHCLGHHRPVNCSSTTDFISVEFEPTALHRRLHRAISVAALRHIRQTPKSNWHELRSGDASQPRLGR